MAVAVFSWAAGPAALLGQSTPDEVIRVETNLVTLPVVVTDQRNRRVTGLAEIDFELETGGRPVTIEYFSPRSRRVALLYALDASGSARDTVTHQREAALALFSKFGRGSRIAVIHFRERSELALNFSQEAAAEARAAFRVAASPNSKTAVFDAALAAARAFDVLVADKTERRIVVLLTDGLDTAS
ncbi:MAG: VWA domain-containing protein [Pyrinomonadaceae bacterium]